MKKITDFNRMKKIAYVLQKVFMVLFVGCIIGIGLLLMGEIIVTFIPETVMTISFEQSAYINDMLTQFTGHEVLGIHDAIRLKPILLIVIGAIIFNLVFYVINFWFLSKILGSVGQDQPFDVKNAERLSVMGITFIIGALIKDFVGEMAFVRILATVGLEFEGFMSYSMNFNMLFTGVLLLVLSGVFHYGVYLQYEYDETV